MSWQIPPKDKRVMQLRNRRNRLEGQLKRCEIQQTRDYYTLNIENINILLQDMGVQVYTNAGGRHKAKF